MRMNRLLGALLLSCCMVGSTGCHHSLAYRQDIQQGNMLNETALASLQVGMSQERVIELMGEPLLTDPFHSNRWDYIYYHRDGKTGKLYQQHLSVVFQGDLVSEINQTS